MKPLLGLFAIALLGVSVGACGGVNRDTGSTSHTSSNAVVTSGTEATSQTGTSAPASPTSIAHHPKDANDGDNDAHSDDDLEIVAFGQAANRKEARTITAVVNRYYAAAAADDGAVACAQIFSLVAEAIVEDYGEPPGPPNLRGKSCAVVLSKLFKLNHQKMAADAATLKVTGVRTEGRKGFALLRFGLRAPPRYIPVHLEFGVWKIHNMSDSAMP